MKISSSIKFTFIPSLAAISEVALTDERNALFSEPIKNGWLLSGDHKGRYGAAIGIGVTTFNRLPLLKRFVEATHKLTTLPYDLVVADDGSSDGTVEWCRSVGITVIGGVNRGIAWNKNRTLSLLATHSAAGVFVLFDDDCFPATKDWSDTWFKASERWGHIIGVHPETAAALDRGQAAGGMHGGAGTWDNPYQCDQIAGCALGASRAALARVGYFDTRFKGYGHEHSEWTLRFHRFDYGTKRFPELGPKIKTNLMLRHGIDYADVVSTSDKTMKDPNRELMQELKADVAYRLPYRDEEEKVILMHEIEEALAPSMTPA